MERTTTTPPGVRGGAHTSPARTSALRGGEGDGQCTQRTSDEACVDHPPEGRCSGWSREAQANADVPTAEAFGSEAEALWGPG